MIITFDPPEIKVLQILIAKPLMVSPERSPVTMVTLDDQSADGAKVFDQVPPG